MTFNPQGFSFSPSSTEVAPGVFRVLMICTGNVCRSPVAEALLRKKLRSSPFFEVRSAGTMALVNQPVSTEMHAICAREGLDIESFRARKVSRSILANSDLVLTMTTPQRLRILEDWPDSAGKVTHISNTVRLPEFEAFSPASLSEWCRSNRPSLIKDVPDPYQQDASVAEQAFADIDKYLNYLVQWLNPAPKGRRRKS